MFNPRGKLSNAFAKFVFFTNTNRFFVGKRLKETFRYAACSFQEKTHVNFDGHIYIECGLLHITYSISAELFINFNTKTGFFLCSRCCFNNSRTPGAHVAPRPQVGCSGTLT